MTPLHLDAQSVRSQIERLKLLFPELAEDAETFADILEGETELHEILTRLVHEERDIDSFIAAINIREEQLVERRQRFSRKKEALRTLMTSLLEAGSQTKIMLPEATLSIATRPGRPIVHDEAILPDQFCRVKRSPDLTAIKQEIDAGRAVPGVSMSNGSTSLTIRVK